MPTRTIPHKRFPGARWWFAQMRHAASQAQDHPAPTNAEAPAPTDVHAGAQTQPSDPAQTHWLKQWEEAHDQ